MFNGTSVESMLTAGTSLLSTVIASKLQLPISMFATLNLFLSGSINLLWDNIGSIGSINIADLPMDAMGMFVCFCVSLYVIYSYIIPYMQRFMCYIGITDNYYLCRIKTYICRQLGIYQYTIDNPQIMLDVVNRLYVLNYFIEPYPMIHAMDDAQQKIPEGYRKQMYRQLQVPCFNKRFYFTDSDLSVCGYIWFELYYVEKYSEMDEASYTNQNTLAKVIKKIITVNIPTLKMHLVVDCIPDTYIKNVQLSKNSIIYDHIQHQQYIFIEADDNDKYQGHRRTQVISEYTYKDNREDYFKQHYLDQLEKSHIDTFFHPLKHEIWNTIKMSTFSRKEMREQGFSTSFLACLYGPPGTGKSGFPVKIAMATGKNITNVDKSLFYSKVELRKFFEQQLDSDVIIFDEFDHIINMLSDAEDRKALMESRKEDIISTVVNKITGAEPDSDSNSDSDSDSDLESDSETKKSKKKKSKKSKTRVSKHMTPMMLNSLSRASVETTDDDSVTISDLLDIIQGPSADKSLTIFATTNNYESIRERCPRLFRDGRFKPIYFGYPTPDTMNEMTQFYYNCDITEDVPELSNGTSKIPPCRIINHIKTLIATYPDDKDEQYKQFCLKIRYDLDNYKLSECFTQYEGCIDTEST